MSTGNQPVSGLDPRGSPQGTDLIPILPAGAPRLLWSTWAEFLAFLSLAPTFIMDGGGSPITTGFKGFIPIPFACTITAAELTADVSCTASVDVWTSTRANWNPPTYPTSAQSICASALPSLTAASDHYDTTLTGWTKTVAAGTLLAFNVNANDSATLLTLQLTVTRT